MELAGEVEKLSKRLHPRDEEAALDKNLAMKIQKLGHRTMEEVVAAARRIEKILEEQADSKTEHLVNSMQEQIRIVKIKKDLKDAHEQIAAHKATPPSAAAMAATPAPAAAAAAATQAPPTTPAGHLDHDFGDEMNFPRLPRRQLDLRPPRCFLCSEEGHCPARPSSNASSDSRCVPAPMTHLEDIFWSCQPPRTTPIPALMYS